MAINLGEIFEKSWNEWRRDFKLFFKIILLFIILPYGIFYTFSILIQNSESFFLMAFFLIIFLGFFFLAIWGNAILCFFVVNNEKGKMNFKQAVRGGLKFFGRFLGLFIVFGLAVLGLLLLLIVPGIIWMIYWLFSFYILIKENTGIRAAMGKSKILVRGRWWLVFGCLLLIELILGAVYMVFLIPSYIMLFVSIVSGANLAALQISNILPLSYYISFFIGYSIAILLTTPYLLLFLKNLYLQLKANPVKKK